MLEIILIAAVLLIDQITKYCSELLLTPLGTSFPLIPNVLQFTSAHNTGAAWGMLPGFRWLFLPITFFVCALIVYALAKNRSRLTVLSRVTLSLLFAGAVGNAIDRVLFAYVRDFIDFCLINFPIFNIADSSLTIGCILLILDAFIGKERSLLEVVSTKREKKPAHDKDDSDV